MILEVGIKWTKILMATSMKAYLTTYNQLGHKKQREITVSISSNPKLINWVDIKQQAVIFRNKLLMTDETWGEIYVDIMGRKIN